MYAIVKTGGQQFKVEDGDVITVNKIEGDAGAKVSLDQVLMVSGDNATVGTPLVPGAKVSAEIVRQKLGKKVDAFNYKAKKNVRKRWGHREPLTEIKITKITAGK